MRKRIAWLVTCGLVASSLAIPGIAAAHTNGAIAETGGFVLALPGAGLTVDVTLDEVGHIESVDVTDAAAEAESTESSAAKDHRFRFQDDGTRVDVMAKNNKVSGKVKADTLADLVGSHEWSAVLFPELTEDPTIVTFSISDDGGSPVIDDVAVTGLPADADYAIGSDEDEDEDEGAVVMVTFTWSGYTKVLKIKVDIDDDDDESAVLKIELRAKDRKRLRQELASFVGSHTWAGHLCDGTPVAIGYTIGEDGTLALGDVGIGEEVAASAGFTVKQQGPPGFQVRFDDSKARVRIRFGEKDDGNWELTVDAKTTKNCKHDKNGGPDGERRGKKDKPAEAETESEDDD